MTNYNEKLSEFERVIYAEAEKKKKAILEDAEAKKSEILENAKAEAGVIAKSTFEVDEKRIKSKSVVDISKAEIEAGREVIMHRSKLIEELFDEVCREIEAHTKTPAYKAQLAKLAADEQVTGDAVIIVRESDAETAKSLKTNYNFTVEVSKAIKLGGLMIRLSDGKELIDKTFDSAVAEEKDRFVRESGLNIQ